MKKKYEFTGQTKGNLKQIRRMSDGLVGGWIESEANLSHEGTCFVYDDAEVYGNAKVYGNAWVYGNAEVSGDAWVCGNAKVFGKACVCDNAWVSGNVCVYGNARVSDNAEVSGNAQVSGNAEVSGKSFLRFTDRISRGSLDGTSVVISFTGHRYNLTITPEYVFGGCRVFTHEEFAALTLETCTDKGWGANELKAYKLCLDVYKLKTA